MIPGKEFLFIIGAPRSGTTWLQTMVAAHPSICSTIDELKLFDLFTAPLEKSWNSLVSIQKEAGGGPLGLTAVWTESEFYDFLEEFAGRVYSRVVAMKPEATVLLDKGPGYSHYVKHITRFIPEAKFIHIIRDGRDVAASLVAASRGWGRLWASEKVESAAATWKSTVRAAQEARRYRGRYLEVRYEELLTNGVKVLQEVFEFIGVSIGRGSVTAIYEKYRFEKMKQAGTGANQFELPEGFFRKGQAGDWRNILLDPMQRYLFDEIAGDLLRDLGYCDESWWFDRPYQRFTVPLSVMLSSRGRMQTKRLRAIKCILGPKWTERVRTVRARMRGKKNIASI
jgi:hypothetical protein